MQTDLHVHSNRSDGSFSPSELVKYAMQKHLSSFALTDHDTVEGLDEAMAYADALRQSYTEKGEPDAAAAVPEVIPGVELAADSQGLEVHIVGLFINHHNPELQEYLKHFVESRDRRNRKMCALLREAGVDISFEALTAAFPGTVITRAHYARYLLEHGYTQNMKEAFDRYIGNGCPCHVPREKVTPAQAVKLILKADGIPVLAHPMIYGLDPLALDELAAGLKEAGLIGIEAFYSTYSPADEQQVLRLARKYNLLVSGGSDFHGTNKPGLDLGVGYGGLHVPVSVVEPLRATRRNLLFTDLDGTLLQSDGTVDAPLRAALERMVSAGHLLLLSSGRPLPSILEVCEKEKLPCGNSFIIADNGALIYDCARKRPVIEHRIPRRDIRYIVERAKKLGIHIHGYTESEIVCSGRNDELEFYTRRIHMPLKCVDNIADALPDGSYKLLAIHLSDKSVLEEFRDSLLEYCGERIRMSFSNDRYLEILPAQAGKGNALRYTAELLHAPSSRTFAAGDAENDIAMLEAAGIGIAMANADNAVKKAAHVITQKSNDENGLLEIVNRYFSAVLSSAFHN